MRCTILSDMRSAVLFLVPMAGVTALLVWGFDMGWSDPIALALVAACSLVLGRVVYHSTRPAKN
jgi:hypothetical protein